MHVIVIIIRLLFVGLFFEWFFASKKIRGKKKNTSVLGFYTLIQGNSELERRESI